MVNSSNIARTLSRHSPASTITTAFDGVGFCFGETLPAPQAEGYPPACFGGSEDLRTGISPAVSGVIPMGWQMRNLRWVDNKPFKSRTQTSPAEAGVLSHLHGLVLETSI